MGASTVTECCVCYEWLGSYGGPCTLPCGHNGCLQCLRGCQALNPVCPLCRAPFSKDAPLIVNTQLRELVHLASALTFSDVGDGDWQGIQASRRPRRSLDGCGGGDNEGDATAYLYQPSAPPALPAQHVDVGAVLEGNADVMQLEPPQWLPDSATTVCMAAGCGKPFSFLVRSRHHCRCCGGIFCGACTTFLLLPPRFRQPEPQRVCTACAELLMPAQPLLAGTVSHAVQAPVHDVTTDWSVMRAWVNTPHSGSMEGDLYKSANALRTAATSLGAMRLERGLPCAVFAEAHGLAVLSVVRLGAGWSCALGTGVVVARRADGSWSAPSSLQALSTGLGWQLGASLEDVLVVMRTSAAVRAFCASQLGVGCVLGLAAGPLGRSAGAKASASLAGCATGAVSYSLTKGLYAGVALEGTLIRPRHDVNYRFYARRLTPKQLLASDTVAPPAGASAFYSALDDFLAAVDSDAKGTTATGQPALGPSELGEAEEPLPQLHSLLQGSADMSMTPTGMDMYGATAPLYPHLDRLPPTPAVPQHVQQVYQQHAEEEMPWGCQFE